MGTEPFIAFDFTMTRQLSIFGIEEIKDECSILPLADFFPVGSMSFISKSPTATPRTLLATKKQKLKLLACTSPNENAPIFHYQES